MDQCIHCFFSQCQGCPLARMKQELDFGVQRQEPILRDSVAYESYMPAPTSTHRGNSIKLKKCHLRKKRVEWTADLHSRFVKACIQLGPEYAVPKRILEVMGVPDLTREQIASHLQKYRNSMKSFGSDDPSVSSSNTKEDLEGQCASHTLKGIYRSLGTSFVPEMLITTSSLQSLYSDEAFSSGSTSKLGFCGGPSASRIHGQSGPEMPDILSCTDQMISLLPLPIEVVFPGDDCKHHIGHFTGYVMTNSQISVQRVKLEDSSSSCASKEVEHSLGSFLLGEAVGGNGDGNQIMVPHCSPSQEHLAFPMSSSKNYSLQEKPGDDELQYYSPTPIFDHIAEHVYSPALLPPEDQYLDHLLGQQPNAGAANQIKWEFPH